ncbi:TPA: hypothetical protein ACN32D_002125 [Vibrio parahaemolyticus]|uniref:hypothetical protein n=1 Tax=Vibrio harveyi group TaxID=717610 RepID=UPI000471CAB4|nr:hypothetical protein [Vibrio parahaemolyticus]KIT46461.1 hypothetical protein H337_07005 [Vibrio parahaemolyticus EN9701121]EGQ7914079.1 hypothetical protein [Vibrio parahaemolyticus]EGQ9863088.1 hypothetical protein [Vibrio parahaemolyticus]EGW0142871.1 hypothetical protein [Vibrio parahaemolyticus]EHB9909285.1 hypothetical protein [Vibrio parahaemolyticus]
MRVDEMLCQKEAEELIIEYALMNGKKYYTKRSGKIIAPVSRGCLKELIESYYKNIDELKEMGIIR